MNLQPIFKSYILLDCSTFLSHLTQEQQACIDEQVMQTLFAMRDKVLEQYDPSKPDAMLQTTILAFARDLDLYVALGLAIGVEHDSELSAVPVWVKQFNKYDGGILIDAITIVENSSPTYKEELLGIVAQVKAC